jgi:hypothetical protein
MNPISNQNQENAMVEEVKTSVEPKNEKKMEKRKGEKTLKTQLKEAKKILEKLEKMNAAEPVIKAQQAEVDRLEREVEQSTSKVKTISGTYVDNVMWFEVVGSGTIINKRIALVKNNRPVDRKKVDQFMALFANYDKYEKAYPIIVTRTLPLIDAGYTVTDVNGKEISKNESHNYFVVLDGQHRTIALMQLASTGKERYATIPNVHLKEINAENVGEYLVDINNVGTSWTAKDKMIVAALTKKDELFENIAERLKEGFNPSTAALIYTKKKIGATLLNKILKSEEYNLPQGAVVDIERGNKFINICKSAGMEIKKLTNRFYIGGFNQFATARSDEDAFEALNNLIGKLNDEMLKKVKCEEDFNGILKEAFESGRYEKSETETNNEETIKEAA